MLNCAKSSWLGLFVVCFLMPYTSMLEAASPTTQPMPTRTASTQPTSRKSVMAPVTKRIFRSKQLREGLKLDPWTVGLDPRVLERWVKRAKLSGSDSFVVIRNGKLVGYWNFSRKTGLIETMSMTKSIVGLAFGKLLEEKKIKSLDTPIAAFYPEWKKGPRSKVTIKHILTHSSGLRSGRTTKKIYASFDFIKYALKATLFSPPGLRFRYNNRAINLLAGIVQKASGKRLDLYIAEKIFRPLGITKYHWILDRSGHPHGMSGLRLGALDLAKIGVMMLNGGTYRGRRILSKRWVQLSTRPHPHSMRRFGRHPHGLLWWLLPAPFTESIDAKVLQTWKNKGLPQSLLTKLSVLKGHVFVMDPWETFRTRRAIYASFRRVLGTEYRTFRTFLRKHRLPRSTVRYGRSFGFSARGDFGQFLVVLPLKKMVVVRQIRAIHAKMSTRSMRRFDRWLARTRFPQIKSKKRINLLHFLYTMGTQPITVAQTKGLLPKLMKLLNDPDPLVRDYALWLLGKSRLWMAKAEPKVLQRLKLEAQTRVKKQAFQTLSLWSSGSLASRKRCLGSMLDKKEDWYVRVAAAEASGRLSHRDLSMRQKLFALLKDPTFPWVLKRAFVDQMVKMGIVLSKKLNGILGQAREPRRYWAARMMLRLPYSDQKRSVIAAHLLYDPQWAIRRMAREVLSKMGGRAESAIPIIGSLTRHLRKGWRKMFLLKLQQQLKRAVADKRKKERAASFRAK